MHKMDGNILGGAKCGAVKRRGGDGERGRHQRERG